MCSFSDTKFQDVAQHVKHPSIPDTFSPRNAITLSIEQLENIEGYTFLVILFAQKEKRDEKDKDT